MSIPTVLIADDDHDLLDALATRISSHGCHVVTAADGLTAVSCIDVTAPDLIILDIEMPGGNGLAVCEMVATNEKLAHTPVIVLSGQDSVAIRNRCRQLGATRILKSPHAWLELQPHIESLHNEESTARRDASARQSASKTSPLHARGL